MSGYTMFASDGVPVRVTLATGWVLEVGSGVCAGPPPGARDLPGSGSGGRRLWCASSGRSTPGAYFLPEVGDEVLVGFEHGQPAPTTVVFNPTELSLAKSVPWKHRQPTASGAFAVKVLHRGSGPLEIGVETAATPSTKASPPRR